MYVIFLYTNMKRRIISFYLETEGFTVLFFFYIFFTPFYIFVIRFYVILQLCLTFFIFNTLESLTPRNSKSNVCSPLMNDFTAAWLHYLLTPFFLSLSLSLFSSRRGWLRAGTRAESDSHQAEANRAVLFRVMKLPRRNATSRRPRQRRLRRPDTLANRRNCGMLKFFARPHKHWKLKVVSFMQLIFLNQIFLSKSFWNHTKDVQRFLCDCNSPDLTCV